MPKFPFWLLLSAWLVASPVSLWAQTNTNAASAPPSTNAPAATPPAANPIPLAKVAMQVTADTAKLQEMQAAIAGDHTAAEVEQSTAEFAPAINSQKKETDNLLQSSPSLGTLRTAHTAWQMLSNSLSTPVQTLGNRIAQLDANETDLAAMRATWQATLKSANASAAPPDVLGRINSVIGSIDTTQKASDSLRARILTTQNGLTLQTSRISTELDAIQRAQAAAVKELFVRDNPPLWALGAPSSIASEKTPNGFRAQIADVRAYVAQKFSTCVLHLVVFLILSVVLIWVRGVMAARAIDDPAVQHSAQIFRMPLAVAALLTLLIRGWFYPLAPPLFLADLGVIILIPTVLILRRLVDPALYPILYALIVAYLADHFRGLAVLPPVPARLFFLLEISAAMLFTVWLLRSERMCHASSAYILRILRAYAWTALAVFALALVADILGYTSLATTLGNGILGSIYRALVFYAAVRIADGLILVLLKLRPFALLGMVQRYYLRMAEIVSRLVRWVAFLCWLWETLVGFSINAPLWNGAAFVLGYTIPYGSLNLSLGPAILFAITIWVTILISRFVRFVLAEEVFPRLELGPGVPYAISTMVHYALLLTGTLFAFSAIKVDLSKYTILAGGLGVGLGLGLQSIMNNFVSGLILLFERPIKVGDVIQVDTAMGTVENIGIRASVIRITDGSEVIMPNGNLISNPVTNWTFSDWRRIISVPIAVAAKADPARVMSLLVETAKAHPLVLKDPAPTVLFTNFTGAALNFELHAWTSSHEWAQIRSDLALSISQALARENVAIT